MPTFAPVTGSPASLDARNDLHLPEIAAGDEPLPSPEPSYELMQAHARFLLRSGADDERQTPSSEPFIIP